jgi:hypothetical protein
VGVAVGTELGLERALALVLVLVAGPGSGNRMPARGKERRWTTSSLCGCAYRSRCSWVPLEPVAGGSQP